MLDNVTFMTTLVPSKETPYAYCVLGGQWLPKSQVKVLRVLEERNVERFRGQPKRGIIRCSVVEVEAPAWLVRR